MTPYDIKKGVSIIHIENSPSIGGVDECGNLWLQK